MVLFAWHLKDHIGLADALPSVIDVLLPGFLADEHLLGKNFLTIPSRVHLRSCQVKLDMAVMLARRTDFGRTAVRYGWADSSTTAKSDWLVLKTQSVPDAEISNMFSAASELVDCTDDEKRGGVLGRLLRDGIRVTSNVPQALALGMTSLEYKVCAVAFSYFMEVGTLLRLVAFLSTFISFTSDMGTELGTASFWYSDIRSLLPAWLVRPHMQPDVSMADDADDMGVFNALLCQFLPRAIIIPGALHILSNLSRDIAHKLTYWPEFLRNLHHFETLLCDRDRRELFVERCVGHQHQDASHFKVFSGSLYEKRWGAVCSFIKKLLPLLPVLKRCWSKEAFTSEYTERDKDKGKDFDPAVFTAVLASPLFAAYLNAMLILFCIPDDLAGWCEGCPCHEHLFEHLSLWRVKQHLEKTIGGPCPVKGQRAPECAAGHLHTVFEEMSKECHKLLLEIFAELGLSDDDRATVMRDFDAGLAHLQLGLQVKMDCWSRLPWKLCGLAHWDQDIARRIALESINQFDEFAGEDPTYVHHHATILFLKRGGALRIHVEAFADGQDMQADLKLEVAKLRFIPIVERTIEAPHAIIKRRSGNQFRTGTQVSLTLRIPDVKDELRRDPRFLSTLVDIFSGL